jgi:hypothetical protein
MKTPTRSLQRHDQQRQREREDGVAERFQARDFVLPLERHRRILLRIEDRVTRSVTGVR